MCSGLKEVCGPIIDSVRKFQQDIPLERVVNIDFKGADDEIFANCWVIANLCDYVWSCRKQSISPVLSTLFGKMKASLNTMSKIKSFQCKIVKTAAILNSIVV